MVTPALINSETLGNAPGSITLPDGTDIDLRCVNATFDGTGAGGSFLACLSIFAASGQLIGRFFPSQTFAIGDSGEVTYAPFLEQAAGSSPPPASSSFQSGLANDGAILGTGTVNNTTLTTISFADGVSVSSGATAIKDNSGASTTQPLQLLLDGWYLFYLDFEWSGGSFTNVRYYTLTFQFNADNDGNLNVSSNESAVFEASHHRTWGPLYFRATSLKPKVSVKVWQSSGGVATITGVLLTVLYLGPDLDPARFPPF